jgi:hypothetical protein
MNVIIDRIKQPSTIKGILGLLSIVGVNMTDDLISGISSLIISAIAVWEIIRNERKIPKAEVVE